MPPVRVLLERSTRIPSTTVRASTDLLAHGIRDDRVEQLALLASVVQLVDGGGGGAALRPNTVLVVPSTGKPLLHLVFRPLAGLLHRHSVHARARGHGLVPYLQQRVEPNVHLSRPAITPRSVEIYRYNTSKHGSL